MEILTKNEAFENGVLTRLNGYGKMFNPFRNTDSDELYKEWLKGWSEQHVAMFH